MTDFGSRRLAVTCSRDLPPLRSSVFKLRPISVPDAPAHSLISLSPKPPPSQRVVSTDASTSHKVVSNASPGINKLTECILSMLNSREGNAHGDAESTGRADSIASWARVYHVLEVTLSARPNYPLSYIRCRDLLPEDNFSESTSYSPAHEIFTKFNGTPKVT